MENKFQNTRPQLFTEKKGGGHYVADQNVADKTLLGFNMLAVIGNVLNPITDSIGLKMLEVKGEVLRPITT